MIRQKKETLCPIWTFSSLARMITFTPLSGSAHSQNISPLAYLLQVDDVRILLDCGSPDWRPEPSFSTENYEKYSNSVKQSVPHLPARPISGLTNFKESPQQSTSSSFHTEILLMPVYSRTRSVDGASRPRATAPSPFRLWPVSPSQRTSRV